MRAYAVRGEAEAPAEVAGTTIIAQLDLVHGAKLVGMLRCRQHYFAARRGGAVHAVDMFFAHANLEQAHADAIADRIVQLGGQPAFSPAVIAAGPGLPVVAPAQDVARMAAADLEALRSVDGLLTGLVRLAGGRDPRTRRMLLQILEDDRMRSRQLVALAGARAPAA